MVNFFIGSYLAAEHLLKALFAFNQMSVNQMAVTR